MSIREERRGRESCLDRVALASVEEPLCLAVRGLPDAHSISFYDIDLVTIDGKQQKNRRLPQQDSPQRQCWERVRLHAAV